MFLYESSNNIRFDPRQRSNVLIYSNMQLFEHSKVAESMLTFADRVKSNVHPAYPPKTTRTNIPVAFRCFRLLRTISSTEQTPRQKNVINSASTGAQSRAATISIASAI